MQRQLTTDEGDDAGSWWSRRCGGREVLLLALPLMISTMTWSISHFTDRMFLLWYSPVAMAAAMPAGMAHFAMLCLPLGIASYVNTFVAQYLGANRPERVGLAVFAGGRVALLFTPLFLLSIWMAPALFGATGHEPDVVVAEVLYFQILAFGAGPTILAAAFSAFFTGQGKMYTVMWVDGSSSLVNIILNYVFIFGYLGFPEGGIEGAAWATVVAAFWRVAGYWYLMHRGDNSERFGFVMGRRFDRPLLARMLKYGGPNGVQMLVEVSGITLFIFLVGKLGQDAMVTTTMAFNVNSVAFIPLLGLGIAVATVVGQQLGGDRPHLAARGTYSALTLALVYSGVMAVLYLGVPRLFLLGYASGKSPEEFLPLADTTVWLLRFVAAFCLFDAIQIVFVSALKGAGDTRFVLIVTAVTSPLPVLFGYAGVQWFDLGLYWCWWILTAWIITLAVIYCARFLQGRWRSMRVIEPDAPLITAGDLEPVLPEMVAMPPETSAPAELHA